MTPINSDHLKRRIHKWANEIGRNAAQRKMIGAGLSYSIAYHLSKGVYPSELKERVATILHELIK